MIKRVIKLPETPGNPILGRKMPPFSGGILPCTSKGAAL